MTNASVTSNDRVNIAFIATESAWDGHHLHNGVLGLTDLLSDANGEGFLNNDSIVDTLDELFHVDSEDSSVTAKALRNEALIDSISPQVSESLVHSLFPNKPYMSSMEMWIIWFMIDWSSRHYVVSHNFRRIQLWNNVRERLYATSELIQSGLYAFSGLILLGNNNRRYLLGDTPIDDGSELSIAKVYNFVMNSYNYLLSATSRQMGKVLDNTCTTTEARVLMTSLTFLFAILERLPSGTCPLVDFTRGGNDFVAYNNGFRQTYATLLPYLQNSPYESILGLCSPSNDNAIMFPFFARIIEFIDTHADGLGTPADVAIVRHAFAVLDQQLYRTTITLYPLECHPVFVNVSDAFWDLVYAQNPLALSWLNVLAAYALVFELYYIRDNNIWVDYMNWYRQRHGQKYFWDEPIYQAVVEQGYSVTVYDLLLYFNPLECATINEIP
ncbi:hypothetical protein DIURU_003287 [Diutina rugosa]|uniref:Transcription factor domain-containing protein n=1 Tax=Diutina rugosa TaxID=5481 RepID=A0A642UNM4_DIURU|nr:uncharacterized protein DIURU_003287 [Diutina rugosa]KAA8901342.1 hypothetical protein DIURU_003287 [Diutina rugosa]